GGVDVIQYNALVDEIVFGPDRLATGGGQQVRGNIHRFHAQPVGAAMLADPGIQRFADGHRAIGRHPAADGAIDINILRLDIHLTTYLSSAITDGGIIRLFVIHGALVQRAVGDDRHQRVGVINIAEAERTAGERVRRSFSEVNTDPYRGRQAATEQQYAR